MTTIARRYLWPNGDEAPVTPEQRAALDRLVERFPSLSPWPTPLSPITVQPMFGGAKDAPTVMVEAAGMWFGIEPDGYTHT